MTPPRTPPPRVSWPGSLSPTTSGNHAVPRIVDPAQHVADIVAVFGPLVLGKSGDLPVLPGVAVEALRRVKDPRVRVDDLLGIVGEDPPLAARILAVANSSFYARGIPIRSLRQAVVRLGLAPLRDVIYMAIYANTIFDAPGLVELVRETFDHSVQVARIAQRLAPMVGEDEELAFLAGLLHDVGRARCLKLFAKHPLTRAAPREVVLEAVEQLHEAAGAALARAWTLPEEVVDACANHHAPTTRFARVVRAADVISGVLLARAGTQLSCGPGEDVEAHLVGLGMRPEDVPGLVEGLGLELGGRVSMVS